MEDSGWMGKHVYVKTREGRAYSGDVINEDDFSITIVDKYKHQVFLNKHDLSILQEEESNGGY